MPSSMLLPICVATAILSLIHSSSAITVPTSSPKVVQVTKSFTEKFGEAPKFIFSAPGRVNLIGEHTDYNDGFVMPCAINHHMIAAITPTESDVIEVVASDYDGADDAFTVKKDIVLSKHDLWSNYVRGVAKYMQEHTGKQLKGCKLAVGGDVPQGAGLSSSAALEIAIGTAFNDVNKLEIGKKQIAMIGRQAEHWLGCNCGIMDQLISACGEKGHSLLIDCRDLTTTSVKIPDGISIIIVNSNFKHQLAGLDSEYNQRRAQCESAARHFGVTALRDVDLDMLLKAEKELDEQTFRRARHVVTENARTVEAKTALQDGDMQLMSKLMAESHASMRDDFEITVPPIDALVEIISKVVGTKGGVRMTGGGFGGSVVCLAPHDMVDAIRTAVEKEYPSHSDGLKATFLVCEASQGAHRVV